MEVYVDNMLVKSLQAEDHLTHLSEMFDILRKYKMKLNPSKCAFGVSSSKFLGFMVKCRGIKANPNKIRAVIKMEPRQTMKEVQQLTWRIAALNHFVSKVTDNCLPFFKILKKVSKFDWTPKCQEAFLRLKEYLSQPLLLSKPQPREDLYLYLAVSSAAVNAMLIREEGGIQLPVYYIRHSMVLAKMRYPSLEKLALALLVASQKLRPYFQAHLVIVYISHPLRQVLHYPEASG